VKVDDCLIDEFLYKSRDWGGENNNLMNVPGTIDYVWYEGVDVTGVDTWRDELGSEVLFEISRMTQGKRGKGNRTET